MKALILYGSSGVVKASVTNIEYNGEHMGDCTISVNFKSHKPIPFDIGDFIEYRGERFILNQIPAVKKISSRNSSGDSFTYDNVLFYTYAYELKRCKFLDYVLNDNKVHWTSLPTFSFYCESVSDLAERIQANLDRAFGKNKWSVKVDESFTEKRDKSISVDNQSCWDALSLVNTDFKTNFIIRGRKIFIGGQGELIANKFSYGIGKGLISLERTIDDSKELITRLRAYGNTTNMPTSYYKWISMGFELIDFYKCCKILWVNNSPKQMVLTPYFEDKATNIFEDVQCYNETSSPVVNPKISLVDINPRIQLYMYVNEGTPTRDENNNEVYPDSGWVLKGVNQCDFCSYPVQGSTTEYERCWVTRGDSIIGQILRLEDLGGFASKKNYIKIVAKSTRIFKFSHLTSTDIYKEHVVNELPFNTQNNMAVTRLMLPMFPNEKGTRLLYTSKDDEYYGYKLVCNQNDVYIDSANRSKYGTYEGTMYVDGTDNETTDEDVFPSIENITFQDLKDAGCEVYGDLNSKINTVRSSDKITDDGDLDLSKVEKNYVFIWINNIGFDINDYKSENPPSIYFKTGMCVGREFEIASCEKVSTGYKLKILRKTDGDINVVFPNKTFCISAGDEFVLLNIKMPDLYIKMASERLLRLALPYLKKFSKQNYVYQPKIDNLWFWRQHQAAKKFGKKSLYSTIKEGDIFFVDESADLNISEKVRISTLKITENDSSSIPQIDITLKDDER
jgi:hypothetical protein